MKKEYSSKWVASKQPRKQRKFLAKAPIHKKRKLLSVNLSKELRKKYETRNIVVRKDDKIKIMRGKHKGKQGKVTKVNTKLQKIFIENLQVKKQDGSMANIPFRPSNLQIVELYMEDKKRIKKQTPKKEEKQESKENKK